MPIPVTAIFDIGKTNKKFFLFDRNLQEVYHTYKQLPLTVDEDGDSCDDLPVLSRWIIDTVNELASSAEYILEAINFSTYGATLVHLDKDGKPVTPLYNYLKPFPSELSQRFIEKYGHASNDRETASPFLGMLNSGLQLYWLKYARPEAFNKIKYTLHFPQYLSFLFTGKAVSEPTSVGCHTKLWNFDTKQYHSWLKEENVLHLLPETVNTNKTVGVNIKGRNVKVGVGIHDSSSALTAYTSRTSEPFILMSTGTWSITLNPFTEEQLTFEELAKDCLQYLDVNGNPVKASRLFLGNELNYQLDLLTKHFQTDQDHYRHVRIDKQFVEAVKANKVQCRFYPATIENPELIKAVFEHGKWDVSSFSSFGEAYHQLVWGLAKLQVASVRLAVGRTSIRKIFIDGGFVDNELFIKLLEYYLPEFQIEVSNQPLGSAYGAALVLNYEKVGQFLTP